MFRPQIMCCIYLCTLDAASQALESPDLLDRAPSDPPDIYTPIPAETDYIVAASTTSTASAGKPRVAARQSKFIYCSKFACVVALSGLQMGDSIQWYARRALSRSVEVVVVCARGTIVLFLEPWITPNLPR